MSEEKVPAKVTMRTDEEFVLEVGFKKKITFYLRMVSSAQESAYTKRFVHIADLPDEERARKEYAIIVETLGQWSYQTPTVKGGDTGDKDVPIAEGAPQEAVKEYFQDMTKPHERIIHSTMIHFRNAMSPDVNFL